MTNILFFIAGIALGFYIKGKTQKTFAPMSEDEIKNAQEKSKKALIERTEERKEKILETLRQAQDKFAMGCNLREGENKKGINSEDVGELLDVSKGTACKYLNELEAEKKIKQVGTTGVGVYYILSN